MDEMELSEEERQYIEEVILFNNAGIKACVFHKAYPGECNGRVQTVGKPPVLDDEGNRVKYGLRMNLCEAHFGLEEGWQIFTDE